MFKEKIFNFANLMIIPNVELIKQKNYAYPTI